MFTGPGGTGWEGVIASTPAAVPVTFRTLDELTARALGLSARGALLVRPDGVPAGLWPGEVLTDGGLSRAVRAVTGQRDSLVSCAA
jgi:hypothetical protein